MVAAVVLALCAMSASPATLRGISGPRRRIRAYSTAERRHDPRADRSRIRTRPPADGDRRARRGVSRGGGAGERRRYTKRFLDTRDGDFGQWTEREWRILARLIGHGIDCVPDVVQFDRGAHGGTQLVQTYDAGATVDQWATLLPVERDGRVLRHVFEDCAHWWALAHHCLPRWTRSTRSTSCTSTSRATTSAFRSGRPNFDPDAPDAALHPAFRELALIDFAFSLVSRESADDARCRSAGRPDYDYQSPRLLQRARGGPPRRSAADARARLALRHVQPRGDAEALPAGRAACTGTTRATAGRAERYDAANADPPLRDGHDRECRAGGRTSELMEYRRALVGSGPRDLARRRMDARARRRHARRAVAADAAHPMTRVAPAVVRTRATACADGCMRRRQRCRPCEQPRVAASHRAARLAGGALVSWWQSRCATAVTAHRAGVAADPLIAKAGAPVRRPAARCSPPPPRPLLGCRRCSWAPRRSPRSPLLPSFVGDAREPLAVAATKRA